jgi:hypothetical protein
MPPAPRGSGAPVRAADAPPGRAVDRGRRRTRRGVAPAEGRRIGQVHQVDAADQAAAAHGLVVVDVGGRDELRQVGGADFAQGRHHFAHLGTVLLQRLEVGLQGQAQLIGNLDFIRGPGRGRQRQTQRHGADPHLHWSPLGGLRATGLRPPICRGMLDQSAGDVNGFFADVRRGRSAALPARQTRPVRRSASSSARFTPLKRACISTGTQSVPLRT